MIFLKILTKFKRKCTEQPCKLKCVVFNNESTLNHLTCKHVGQRLLATGAC